MAGRHAGQYDDDFGMPLMMMMIQSLNSRLPVLQNVFVPPHKAIRVVCSVMVVNLTTGNGQVLSIIMKILMMMML